MEICVKRLNGTAVIKGICEQLVILFWIKDNGDAKRKTFKNDLLREFTGKLEIVFYQKGKVVMNDMIGIVSDDVNMMEFKAEIITTHKHSLR